MRILLTHAYFLYEDEKERQIMRPYPPLGLQYVAAFLEEHGFPTDIYDTTFASFEALKRYLRIYRPSLLGIYTNLMTRLKLLEIIQYVKNEPTLKETKIVLGGPEVRYHKDAFLDYGADIIVMGEGEQSMLELAHAFSAGKHNELFDIPGIAFRDGQGVVVSTGERSLIHDLDTLPMPSRGKIDMQRYFDTWKEHHGYSMLSVSTMRGCPYGCKWCSRAVYGKSYRRRSPEKVVEELINLQGNYQFDKIWFVDDVFTINHKWLRRFAELIKEKSVNIAYEAISRADRMNEEVVQLLKESGCFRIWIGAESGSQAILDNMNRMVKIEKVAEMVRLTKQYGIEAGTFIMLGYPGETEEDIRETLAYLRNTNPDHFTLTVAYPIKGTPFYEEVESQIVNALPWENSTDRDIAFKRAYPRKYYDHAMNWINREMAYYRLKGGDISLNALFMKVKALRSRVGMYLERFYATFS